MIKRIIDGKEVWVEPPIEAAGLYYRVPYLVIPRVLVTEMPYEWQEKWVELARELQDAWDWSQIVNDYTVLPKRGGKFTKDELRNYRHFPMARIEELRTKRPAERQCPACGGLGFIEFEVDFSKGGYDSKPCPDCHGTGRVQTQPNLGGYDTHAGYGGEGYGVETSGGS